MADIIQFRRGTAAAAFAANALLAEGEMGYETDTRRMKVGDGITLYNDLPYFSGLVPILDVQFVFDQGGIELLTGIHGKLRIPFACTILAARLVTEHVAVGDLVIDVYKGLPDTVSSIIGVGGTKPTIIAGNYYEDLTLTGWDKDILAGQYLRYNVDSVASHIWANLILTVLKFN